MNTTHVYIHKMKDFRNLESWRLVKTDVAFAHIRQG